ncbi:type IV secretion system protein VirB5 [Pseudoduganella lurida]|uniref:Type IV secretion system protein VirB5 n=1 Tax=Pseudoduganella lurida TaxID=1036180 RepID=A0A562R0F7_9BURK|nr:conjugal transfer protein TrbF [Pseudoduganella lurida]TWI62555.1 type IV secretion system protein VirB5 [Pseudoduganella lurida]
MNAPMFLKRLIARENPALVEGGRREGENDNPYLSARRTWNEHVGGVVAARRNWQLLCILSLLVALAAVGGMIHIGSQTRFVPYVVQVDRLGQPLAVAPAQKAAPADPRVIHAAVAAFIGDIRLVTPDIALQRKAVFRVYAMLAPNDPATARANEWLNGSEENSPFRRAANETASTEIVSVLPQTADTWQVDWTETVRDRQGVVKGKPYQMRALVTVYTTAPTPSTTEEDIRNNPLGIHVRDFSWSKLL